MVDQSFFRTSLPKTRRRSYDDSQCGNVSAGAKTVNLPTGRKRSNSDSFTSSSRAISVNALLQLTGILEADFDSGREIEYYQSITSIYRRALLTHAGSFELGQRLGNALLNLGASLLFQYRAESQELYLCQAIEAQREACGLVVGDKCSEPLNELGHCLRLRYQHFGDAGALEESLLLHEAALDLNPPGHPTRSRSLHELSRSLFQSSRRNGDPKHLKRAMDLDQEALQLRPEDHPDRIYSLSSLCANMIALYEQDPSLHHLDQGIQFGREAVSLGHVGHPEFSSCLNHLAINLGLRYEATGAVQDLEDACAILTEAVACFPEGSSSSHAVAANLAIILFKLSHLTSSVSPLRRSISISSKIIQGMPRQHPQLARTLDTLAMSFQELYKFTGLNADLEEAIRLRREVLELCDPYDSEYALFLANLSSTLVFRYSHRGSYDDLDEALQLSSAALNHKTMQAHQFPVYLLIHAQCVELSAQSGRLITNRDEVIFRLRLLASELPADNFRKADALLILGQSLRWRYEQSGNGRDIEDAMEVGARALASLTSFPHLRSEALYQHAQTCLIRFRRLRDIHDLQSAYDNLVDALLLRPVGFSDRVEVLTAIFFICLESAAPMHDPKQALSFLREAVNDVNASAGMRLRLASGALSACNRTLAEHSGLLCLLLDIYTAVVHLMQRAALLGFTLRDQISFLQNAESIASEAGQCAVKCDRVELAIELLEEGRATFWSHSLRLRAPFDDLPEKYRQQLQTLTHAINASLLNPQSESNSKAMREEQARLRIQQREHVEQILEEVRQIPGFEQLLLPPSFSMLAHASSCGTVVVLIASKISCMALAVNPEGEVQHVPLPSVSPEGLEEMSEVFQEAMSDLQRGRRRRGNVISSNVELNWSMLYENTRVKSNGVMRALWEDVAKPVLDALKLQRSEGRERPRLWWCQTGPFTFLPIHAAGIYADETSGTDCCANYVVSSYTPTLTALLQARDGFSPIPHEKIRVLLAAVPKPFEDDWMELPGTRREVRQLMKNIPPHTLVSLPLEDDASISYDGGASIASIEENVHSATILHLSSHGWQNPDDPLSSGFVMRDGMLTVERLMRLSLPNAFLAFLSACETAKGDHKQPNQVIHLAAAMLFTGFRSVVGTMWSIDEDDGVFVATEFHRLLLGGSKQALDADDVAYALDEAITKLRERDNHPGRWASYIHLGI